MKNILTLQDINAFEIQGGQTENMPNFKGSRALVVINGQHSSRVKLPFLRPENEVINMWNLLGKLFG